MATTIRTETRKRGVFGWVFVILFWVFNAFFALAFFAGVSGTVEDGANLASDAERAGHAIGTAIGAGMLLTLWLLGAVILGIFVMLTRGRKVIVETSKE